MIEKLTDLERAATPGPWTFDGDRWGGDIYGPDPEADYVAVDHEGISPSVRHAPDGELIAASRNALPALLEVARAAAAYLDRPIRPVVAPWPDPEEGALRTALSALDEVGRTA